MTFQQEFNSWFAPKQLELSPVPQIGAKAPSTEELKLPRADGTPVVATFLRHCGCPFAEKNFIQIRDAAKAHPNIHFVAVSHSDKPSTDTWLNAVGGSGDVEVIVDGERNLFARYGLGVAGWAHLLNTSMFAGLFSLSSEGIKNRPTQTGNRWQTSGSFAIDGKGVVRWGGAAASAQDMPDFEDAVKALA